MQARIRATLDKQRADVSAMFDALAPRYDLLNDILSLGSDRGWRRATTAAVAPGPGEHILDLAGGTGASSLPFLDAGAHVFPTDLSLGMLTVGKQAHPQLCFVAGDALQLPFADDSFDAVTISYGLRNVQDTAAALREMLRVTRPGGRLVIAEFSTPSNPVWRFLYQQGALRAVPLMAKISPNPVAYGYLAESIVAWPAQALLADLMHQIGWRDIEWQDLTGGIVALHRAWKR